MTIKNIKRVNNILDETLENIMLNSDDTFDVDSEDLKFSFDDTPFTIVSGDGTEGTMTTPVTDEDSGVAKVLSDLVKDEYEAIDGYNSAIATLKSLDVVNPKYADMIKVLQDISTEENIHVGQLQALLERVQPNAVAIDDGHEEAISQLEDDSNVLHPGMTVKSFAPVNANSYGTNSQIDEICTVDDIDDDF